jgi:hypothetical protein
MQETHNGFRVQIPPKRRKLALVFYSIAASLIGTAVWYSLKDPTDSIHLLVLILVISFTFLGIVFGVAVELFGRETIELDGFLLTVSETTFGFKPKRRFDITLMRNLTVGSANFWQGDTYVMSDGRIHFEYNSRMVSIGGMIDENEAFDIVHRIRKQLTAEKVGT